MDRRYIDVILGSALIVGSIVILSSDGWAKGGVETQLGSLFLPRVVAVFIILFSAMIAIPSLRGIAAGARPTPAETLSLDDLGGVAVYVAIFAAYWWFLPVVGFLVATPIVMFAIAVLLGGRNWLAMAAVSVITSAVIFYGCRELIRIYLPEWSL